MSNNPKISVIIPVYNCIEYFSQCIDSLLAQTFREFEIIIVDDGSTDGTYELAENYALKNEKITLYHQSHCSAGMARNLGITKARGEYLLFLDGDDYFQAKLLADSLNRIQETNADICVFGASALNNQTGTIQLLHYICRLNLCPLSGVFNRITNPRYIFCFTTPAPWNKLFKKSFIEQNHLRFQDIRSANDFCFTLTALATAEKIAVLDKHLVVYRQQNSTSLQATQHKDPFSFYRAIIALRTELESRDLMKHLRHAYLNTALDCCMHNLWTLRHDPVSQKSVFEFLKTEAFEELGLSDKQRDYFYVYPQSKIDDFERVKTETYEVFASRPQSATTKRKESLFKKTLRSIIPLRASVFEKSRHTLNRRLDSEFCTINAQLAELKEQNHNLADKLAVCLDQLQSDNPTQKS